MALRFNLSPPTPNSLHHLSKPRPYSHPFRPISPIQCIKNHNKPSKTLTDSELAKDLAVEIKKINTLSVLKQEAMNKSKEMLFNELCQYAGEREDELKSKWRRFGEDEKWVLVKGFVDEWGVEFRPLSLRCVKGMVEECCCLDGEKRTEPLKKSSSFSSGIFPGLKRLIGFPEA